MTAHDSRSAGWATAALLLLLLLPAPARAQGEIVSVYACGQQRCGTVPELDAGIASTLTERPGRPVSGGKAFYDVFVVYRAAGGLRTTGAVVRYAFDAGVVRATGPDGAVTWHETSDELAKVLDRAAFVGTPRSAADLNRPAAEIAATTAEARRTIAAGPATGRARTPADDDASIPGWVAVGGVSAAVLVLLAIAAVSRRTRTPTRPRP